MWALPIPNDNHLDVLRLCSRGFTDADLRARLTAAERDVDASVIAFNAATTGLTLHELPRGDVGAVRAADMVKAYEEKMVHRTGSARRVYDRLSTAAPHGRCPLCGVGNVKTLDHHLPKMRYPALAVAPTNLIPACHECNFGKRSGVPINGAEHTLHPYFDSIDDDVWLVAEVLHVQISLRTEQP